MHVLLVDDEPCILDLVGRVLARRGHSASTAQDGEAAIAALRAGLAPDVVVTDLDMPRADGFAVLEAARAREPAIPVVVASGSVGEEARARVIALGADAVLEKPFRLDDLVEAVERALAAAPATA
jgi:CheY-like chemotaxis protein